MPLILQLPFIGMPAPITIISFFTQSSDFNLGLSKEIFLIRYIPTTCLTKATLACARRNPWASQYFYSNLLNFIIPLELRL